MQEVDPEDLRCSLECCAEEFTTHLDLKRAKELTSEHPNEQVYELDEPIKIFLFDIPKAQYFKRTLLSGIFGVCNVLFGGVCVVMFMFPFCGKYIEFSRNLHVPLCVIGMIYHVTPGMMSMSKFFDSSHVLKWIDRRSEHALQMIVSSMFLFFGLGLFFWERLPRLDTTHAISGLAAVLANLTAFVTGCLACLGSVPGPRGARGVESFMTKIHSLTGIVTYAVFVVSFALGFKNELKIWIETLFGDWICYLMIGITVFLYLVSLAGPILRYKSNKAKAKLDKKLKKMRKNAEKEAKQKEQMAKLGMSPEGLK